MKKTKRTAFIILLSLLSFNCNSRPTEQRSSAVEEMTISQSSPKATVEEKWQLPAILEEVSGIVYLDANRFACVQDELGIIFIYNTSTSEIEKEIAFAGAGDYEGLALAGETAFVLRSDGTIFEVVNWKSDHSETIEHSTPLTAAHNLEGLCLDEQNNRLLLAIKGAEPGNKDYKGIYAFDLSAKKLAPEPVFKIDLNHPVFEGIDEKKNKIMRPSAINIHPQTGDIYIADAKDPKILIMNPQGEIQSLHPLSRNDFAQAEGIAFSPSGELFISNEGKKGTANILKVRLGSNQ